MTLLDRRREFVKELLADCGDLLVVSGLGSATYDTAAGRRSFAQLLSLGMVMGNLMIGLGLALAQPNRRVAVLTGDGDMLMGIGSLATIGVKQPMNLAIVVLDNAHYGETGMQPSATKFGIDLVATALCLPLQASPRSVADRGSRRRPRIIVFGRRPGPGPGPHQGRRRASQCFRSATAMPTRIALSRRWKP